MLLGLLADIQEAVEPLHEAPPSYFVTVGAVVARHAAMFETTTGDSIPLRLIVLEEDE